MRRLINKVDVEEYVGLPVSRQWPTIAMTGALDYRSQLPNRRRSFMLENPAILKLLAQ